MTALATPPFSRKSDYEGPLLEILADQPEGQAATAFVMSEFWRRYVASIPAEHQVLLASSANEPKWRNIIRWARLALIKRGWLESPARGIWRITDAGRVYLAQMGNSAPVANSPSPLAKLAQAPECTATLSIGGAPITLTVEEVLDAARREIARGLPLAARSFHSWVVEVDGQEVGLKWLFGLATGLSHADFKTNKARRAFEGLGIAVRRAKNGVRGKAVAEVSTFTGRPGRSPKDTRVETLAPAREIVDARIAAVRDFLSGRASRPSDERLCDWVHLCYEFELYREGRDLFALVDPSQVNTWYYERAKRLAKVCAMKAAGQA